MSYDNQIPQKVDPFRFAENGIVLEGVIPVKDLTRLISSLDGSSGEIQVNVKFGIDEQGTRYMRGDYSTKLELQCKRCMKPFAFSIDGAINVGIVAAEDKINQLPSGYDAMTVKDGSLIISEIVEDELIIGLPIVPMHDIENCNVKLPLESASPDIEEVDERNPFKVIESLRNNRKDK